MSGMVTLREACERLGWGTGKRQRQRLYERLEAAEKRDGVAYLVRGVKNAPTKVSWVHVRMVSGERSAVESISGDEWNDAMADLDCRMAHIADERINVLVAPKLTGLETKIEKTAKAVKDLKDRLVKMV